MKRDRNNVNLLEIDDEQILGAYLFLKHNKQDASDFNKCYTVDILSNCNPKYIHKLEQHFIQS